MKVFISHSWKNKTPAQQIADAVKEAGVEVWLDVNNLLPGQAINVTIDKALTSMDVVLLLWSEQALGSDGVAAEMDSCARLQKLVIPCLLDDTPLSSHPSVHEIKGIGFGDLQDGIGRLKMVLLNYMMAGFNMQHDEAAKKMNEFMGSLETAAYLSQTQKIKETGTEADKDFWVNKIQSTEAAAEQRLRQEQQTGKAMEQFLQEKMDFLQNHLNDRNACEQVLADLKAFEHAQHPAMQVFIQKVQQICNSFGPAQQPEEDVVANFKKDIEEKIPASFRQLMASLGSIIPEAFIKPSFDNLAYFITSAAGHLQLLIQNSQQENAHPAIADCAQVLQQYIQTPGGVIDNNQYGILGYADDAYLVHSLVTALQQEGLIDTGSWDTDWDRINAGCDIAFSLIGQQVKQQLDSDISNFCRALVQKYNPQYAQQHQEEQLQKAKDDLWRAKLTSLQGDLYYGHNPEW